MHVYCNEINRVNARSHKWTQRELTEQNEGQKVADLQIYCLLPFSQFWDHLF